MPAQLCGETTTSHFICCSQLRTHLQGRGVHHPGWAKLTAWDERKKREPSMPSQDRSSVVCSVPGHGAQQPVVLGDSGDSQAQTRQEPSSQQCPASSSCSHLPTQLLAGPYSHATAKGGTARRHTEMHYKGGHSCSLTELIVLGIPQIQTMLPREGMGATF